MAESPIALRSVLVFFCRARFAPAVSFLLVVWLLFFSVPDASTDVGQPAETLEILADFQQKTGDTYLLRGNVEIRFRGMTLKADEVTYNETSREATARGNVVFERENEQLHAREGTYNLRTGQGRFEAVRGTVGLAPRPDPNLLVSPNPLYFEARWAERRSNGTYVAHNGWVTNCTPESAKWKLKAKRANIRPGERVTLYRSTFVLAHIPILYVPVFTHSLQERPRGSGFLLPSIGVDSRRGTAISEGFFWAINPHADVELRGDYYSNRGWGRRATFRALPTSSSAIYFDYLGVTDKGQPLPGGRRGVRQGGDFFYLNVRGNVGPNWQGVVDIAYLSSFLFRLGFTETFTEAVVSEVRSNAFVTANPDTYYFNGFFRHYRNFLTVLPETAITLTSGPSFEFGTRPRWLGRFRLPVYLSLDASVGGLRRSEPRFETPPLVQRFDFYPRITIPLLRSPYIQVTPSFGLRATRYGARQLDDPNQPTGIRVVNRALGRVTEEASVDIRLPSVGRIYERSNYRHKHLIESQLVYRYVTGVDNFDQILRFDDTDILSNTHEIEYSLTNRLWQKSRQPGSHPREWISWRLAQKYFLDPTLGGTIEPSQRNVAAALASLTGFSYSNGPRSFSPLISTVKLTPGSRYDAEWRVDFDPEQGKLINSRLMVSATYWRSLRSSLIHFSTRNDPVLQPRSNQLGTVIAWGGLTQRGFNAAGALFWNIRRNFLQNQVVQLSYNWDCCGIAVEFRRLGLGPLRSENQYRFAFFIASVGTAGTLRRTERIF